MNARRAPWNRVFSPLLAAALVASSVIVAVSVTATPANAETPPESVATRYSEAVLADVPGLYYRLENVGSVQVVDDSSGAGRDGVLGSGVTGGEDGALAGVGDDDLAVANDGSEWTLEASEDGLPVDTAARSVELWFRTTEEASGWLFSYGAAPFGVVKEADSARLRVHLGADASSDYWVSPALPVTDGRWHQLVLVGGAESSQLYIDGQPVGSGSGIDSEEAATFHVGQLEGSFDEVAVYPAALEASQISRHWSTGASVHGADACPVPEQESAYAQAVLADEPLTYLRPDIASDPDSTVVLDHSGRCAHAVRGSSTTSVPGAVVGEPDTAVSTADGEWALQFGVDTAADGFDSRSVELWFQTTESAAGWLLQSGSTGAGVYKPADSTKLKVYLGADKAHYTVATQWPVTDGSWHQLVLTSQGDRRSRIYIDGQLLGGGEWIDSWGVDDLDVGGLAGSYDEVSVYPSVLSATQVAAHWGVAASALDEPCPGEASSSDYAQAVLADKPALYLPGDQSAVGEESPVVLDYSGRCAHAARTAAVGTTAGAVTDDSGSAWNTDGGQWAILAGGSGLPAAWQPRTVEIWFTATEAAEGRLFSYGSGDLRVFKAAGETRLRINNGLADETKLLSGNVTDGDWHQLVLTLSDDGASRGYIDGRFSGMVADSYFDSGDRTALRVGEMPGSYDELAVYPAVLSAAQIADHWSAGASPPEVLCPVPRPTSAYAEKILADKPQMYYRGTELASAGTSPTALDYSGNCSHGLRSADAVTTTGAITGDDDPGVATAAGEWALETDQPLAAHSNSVELWFKTTAAAEGWLLQYGSFGAGIHKEAGAEQLVFEASAPEAGTIPYVLPWPVADDKWHHLAVVNDDDSREQIYLDGQLVFAGWSSGFHEEIQWRVGEMAGAYDEIASYSAGLSQSQVMTHWAGGRIGGDSACASFDGSGHASIPLTFAPSAYYRLDAPEATTQGVALDSSSYCRAASLSDAVNGTDTASGTDSLGNSLVSDGSEFLLRSASDQLVEDFGDRSSSVETWFKTTSSAEGWLLVEGSLNRPGFGVFKEAGSSRLRVDLGIDSGDSRYVDPPGSPIDDGSWHQLVTVFADDGWLVYVDGQLADQAEYGDAGRPWYAYASTLEVGQLPGSYDDIAIYSHELPAEMIAFRWNALQLREVKTELLLSGAGTAAEPVTLTFTIAPAVDGGVVPTGSVEFWDDASRSELGVVSLAENGTASLTTTLAPGRHEIQAFYSGDQNFTPAVSSPARVLLVPGEASSTTSLSLDTDSTTYGGTPIIAHIQVSGTAAGGIDPTGLVRIFADDEEIQATCLGASYDLEARECRGTTGGDTPGEAFDIPLSGIGPGSTAIRVVYEGDAVFDPSQAEQAISVAPASTELELTASSDHINAGEVAELSVAVPLPGPLLIPASGRVTLTSPEGLYYSGTLASDGTTTFDLYDLLPDTYSFVAHYSGDTRYSAATSQTVEIVVAKLVPSMSAYPGVSTLGVGEPLNVSVFLNTGGGPAPTSPVVVREGTRVLGSASPEWSSGRYYRASIEVAGLSRGTHTLNARYLGDEFRSPVTAPAGTVTVKENSSITITLPKSQAVVGETLAATVHVDAEAGQPTGKVDLSPGNGATYRTTVDSNGNGTFHFTYHSPVSSAVTATYLGDETFAPAKAEAGPIVVDKAETTTTVVAAPAVAADGAPVTYTATVSAVSPGSGRRYGFVTFMLDGTTLATVAPDAAGKAVFVDAGRPTGEYHITAVYGGDSNFMGSSGETTAYVNPATTTTVSSNANPVVVGNEVTFTVSVAPESIEGTPGGNVLLKSDGRVLGSGVLDAEGKASIAVDELPVGSTTVTAEYTGAQGWASSVSEPYVQHIGPLQTSVTLEASPETSVSGQEITIVATVVRDGEGFPATTGFVTFRDSADIVATSALKADGTASVKLALRAGAHELVASYGGDAISAASASEPITQTVDQATVSVRVNVDPEPSVSGLNAELTVAVTPIEPAGGSPTGEVILSDGAGTLGSYPVNEGVAHASLDLAPGEHTLVAVYSGDQEFLTAESEPYVHRAVHATTTALDIQPAAGAVFGQPVQLTAQVTSTNGTPTGTVVIRDHETVIGSGELDAAGSVAITVDSLSVGEHDLTATFESAETEYIGSISSAVAYRVSAATTALTLTVPSEPIVLGDSVTLDAAVSVVEPGAGEPSGFVVFRVGDETLGTASIDAEGHARLDTRAFHAGTMVVTAAYGGDSTMAASQSEATFEVDQAPVAVTLAPGASPLRLGEALPVTVSVVSGSGRVPTGTVRLRDGPTVIATTTLDSTGSASFSATGLQLGDHSFVAEYDGDSDHLSAASAPVVVPVVQAHAATVALESSSTSVAYGEQVTITATLTGESDLLPSGFVTILSDGTKIGTATITDGQATFTTTISEVGTHRLTASYGGDSNFYPTVGMAITIEVTSERKVVIVTDPQSLTAGVTSDDYTVRIEDSTGPVNAGTGGLLLTLRSSSAVGQFYSANDTVITAVRIPEGASTASFRYRDTMAGNPVIRISADPETGVGPASQEQVAKPGVLDHVVVTPGKLTVAPNGVQAFAASGRDAWNNRTGDLTEEATWTVDPAGTCEQQTCTFGETPGDYTVTAQVAQVSGTATVVVNNAPVPELSAVSTTGIEPTTVTFHVDASDADGDPLTWAMDFGDGSAATGWEDLPASGVDVSHTYLACSGCVAVLKVSDGKSDPVPNDTLVIDVAEDASLFQANAGDPIVAMANQPTQLDGSASSPGSPFIEQYRWSFGDGSADADSASAIALHTYTSPGDYIATLTISGHGRTSTSQVPVTVKSPAADAVVVAVTSDGESVSGATVMVKDADNVTYRARETVAGYQLDGLPDGSYTVYVAALGYLPTTGSVTAVDGAGFATVDLSDGDLAKTELTSRLLSRDEAIAAGVDVDAPGNQNVYQFKIHLPYFDYSGLGTGEPRHGSGVGHYIPPHHNAETVSYSWQSQGPRLMLIIIPGQAKWLKEMFQVQYMVFNLADESFSFEDGTATLNLPEGLSLADMSVTPQSLAQRMGPVPGGESRIAEWIVRGDTEGFYSLSVDYSAVLQPTGMPIQLEGHTDPDNPLHIWGGSAMKMTVDVDDGVVQLRPNHLTVSLKNVADVPIYNPMITLLPGEQNENRTYAFQPREQYDQGTDRIDPGETFTTREYIVIPDFTGTLNLADSAVVHTGGNQFIPSVVVDHPAPSAASMSADTTAGGVAVSWDPIPGAVGYQVYSTPLIWADFSYQPIVEVGASATSAMLPPEPDGYGVVVVSTLFKTADGQIHNRVNHRGVYLNGFSYNVTDPCTAFGDAPNGSLAGNYVTTADDASVATIGPALKLSRTYNSSNSRVGWFGEGWSSSFEMRVEADGQGNAALREADGRCLYFLRNSEDYSRFDPPPGEYGTLVPDGQGGFTYTSKDRTAYRFDTSGRLMSETDVHGRRLALSYASGVDNHHVTKVVDETSGRAMHMTWADDRVTEIEVRATGGSDLVNTWKYYYDSAQRLTDVCDPRDNTQGGACTTYEHDASQGQVKRITKITRPEGNAAAVLEYDDEGRLIARTDGMGNKTRYSFPEVPTSETDVDRRMTATSPLGAKTTTDYDAQHRVLSVTSPEGGRTSYEYDEYGYRSKTTDPNGNIKRQVHDARGNVIQQIDGEGNTIWMTYDDGDNLTSSRDGRSSGPSDDRYATRVTYDQHSLPQVMRLPATADLPDGAQKSWTYTGGSYVGDGVWEGTDPAVDGGVEPPGMVASETDVLGNTISYSYDSAGNLRREVSVSGLVTTYEYDGLGRRIKQTVKDSLASPVSTAVTTYVYDAVGNIVRTRAPKTRNVVTDEQHCVVTAVKYDLNGRMVKSTDRDRCGDDGARITRYSVDKNDRVVAITDALGARSSRTYDADGRVTSTTDASGRVMATAFDAEGRALSVTLRAYDDGVGGAPRDITVAKYTYDAGGRTVSETDPRGVTKVTEYDKADRPLRHVVKDYEDASGEARDLVLDESTYDGAGHVLRIVSGDGLNIFEQTWDEQGRLVSATLDPEGLNRVTQYARDAAGNALSESRTQGDSTRTVLSEYNAMGMATTVTVLNGSTNLTETKTYDQRGSLLTATDAAGRTTTYATNALGDTVLVKRPSTRIEDVGGSAHREKVKERAGYNAFGDQTEWVNGRGYVTRASYDRLGRQTSLEYPTYTPVGGEAIHARESYVYDGVGNVIKSTDRRGFTTDFTYDSFNRVTQQANPAVTGQPRGKITNTYDDAGNVLAQVDANDARTEWTYDARGSVRTETQVVRGDADVQRFTSTFSYDALGNVVEAEDPLGNVTRNQFNAAAELTRTVDPTGAATTYAYDMVGNVTRTTDALGRSITNDYDPAGRLVATSRIARSGEVLDTTSYSLDPVGNVLKLTQPEGNKQTFVYDKLDRLTKVVEETSASSSTTSTFGYDAADNLTRSTNGAGNTTTYTYTPWDQLESTIEPATEGQTDPVDRTFTQAYDSGGLPVAELQPGGVELERDYDALGRLVSETGSGGGTIAASREFGYDLGGRLTSVSHPDGTEKFAYDDRDLLTKMSGPAGSADYTYDATGNMTSRRDAAGLATFTWTDRGELASLKDPLTNTTQSYTYDAVGQLLTDEYSSGVSRTLSWDDRGRLVTDTTRRASGGLVTSTTYGYDRNDNLTSQKIVAGRNSAAGTHSYSYDRSNRLVSWTDQRGRATAYAYDGAGNRTQAGTTNYTYDARNRLVSAGRTDYTWNARGDLVAQSGGSEDPLVYTYDAFQRLTKVTKGSRVVNAVIANLKRLADAAPGSRLADLINERIKRLTDSGAGSRVLASYSYDGLGRVASRTDADFVYNGLGLDPISDGSMLVAQDPSGVAVAQSASGVASLIGLNRHGDVTSLFAADGSLQASEVYDPWGQVAGSSGRVSSSLGFQGDFTDDATGRVWMGSRWYDPGTGTFSVRDSVSGQVSSPGSMNRYGYAFANPLGMVDRDGHWPDFAGLAKSLWNKVVSPFLSYLTGADDAKAKISVVMGMVELARGAIAVSKVIDITGVGAVIDRFASDPGAALKQGLKFLVPIAVGVATTAACMGVSGGLATPACLVLGGGAAGLAQGVMDCEGMSGSDCARSVVINGAAGAVGGLVGGAVGGKVATALLGRVSAGALSGATGSGVTSAVGQYLATGEVDWRQVGESAALGFGFGAFGGRAGAKSGNSGNSGSGKKIVDAVRHRANVAAAAMSRAWSKTTAGVKSVITKVKSLKKPVRSATKAAGSDLSAFGNRAGPRAPRAGDMEVGADGLLVPQGPPVPVGASTFADPAQAPLSGHYHTIPEGTPMPPGMAVLRDGTDVGGLQPPTHATIYATEPMTPETFIELFMGLPWQYGGKK